MRITTLISGSSGNALYIETKQTRILIDAGQSGKCLSGVLQEGCGLEPGQLDAVFVTHAHRDHILGVGVLSRRYGLPIYATEGTWMEMEPLIGPICPERKEVIGVEKCLEMGDIKIESFATSHDALEPVGYLCSGEGEHIGIATDSGVFTTRMGRKLQNMDCLVLEANHDPQLLMKGPYPWPLKKRIASILGHLSNEKAGQALLRTIGPRTKKVILAHLSEENNRPSLAVETVNNMLKEAQVDLGEVDIMVAPRYRPGPRINISSA